MEVIFKSDIGNQRSAKKSALCKLYPLLCLLFTSSQLSRFCLILFHFPTAYQGPTLVVCYCSAPQTAGAIKMLQRS